MASYNKFNNNCLRLVDIFLRTFVLVSRWASLNIVTFQGFPSRSSHQLLHEFLRRFRHLQRSWFHGARERSVGGRCRAEW